MKLADYRQKINQNQEFVDAQKELQLHFTLANAILKARLEKGFSQARLAEIIGTKQANISKLEAGLGNPTLSMMQKLVNALELEITFSPKNEKQETIKGISFSIPKTQQVLPK